MESASPVFGQFYTRKEISAMIGGGNPVICANCHRMIHRSKPMMTVAELKQEMID